MEESSMTEYNTTDQGTSQAVGAGAESIDLLIRHLELGKHVYSGPEGTPTDEGELKAIVLPDTLCTFLYVASGTFCPLLYVHGH